MTKGPKPGLRKTIEVAPIIMLTLAVALLVNPATRPSTLWMLQENHPIELLTFAVALCGGILGLILVSRARASGRRAFVYGFYALFAAALLFLAMEEVAWGQQFFNFTSPETWQSINAQGETTIHNIVGIQGRSEIFRVLFGLAGLAGLLVALRPRFRQIGAPMILLPWLLIITLHAGIDVFNDFSPITARFDYLVQRTSELIEMFIASSGLIYVATKMQIIAAESKEAYAPPSRRGHRALHGAP